MFCSIIMASWLCFQPAPIVCPPVIIKPIVYDKKATFTAYTLSEDETDGSPEIGAGNHNLREYSKRLRVCAVRGVPLHSKLSIEGIGECEVLDRTSKKYAGRIDILMPTKAEAIKFGKKELKYKLLTPSGK